jgi:nucleoside-diphosphate-sugar epimerase
MRIFVTGSSGFVGKLLVKQLSTQDYSIVAASRLSIDSKATVQYIKVEEINQQTNWLGFLEKVDVVIHLANRAHVMHEYEHNPYCIYREINVEATINLARQAIETGVKRFIYISSVKVNGEYTSVRPFTEEDKPEPEDDYGISKYEAEEALIALCKNAKLELIIIRPPLIYGPNVKGNFFNLIKLCNKSLPLPFGSIKNKRSFVYIDNLISLIETCITHPNAANHTFLVSDNDDQSTTELIDAIKSALGKFKLLIPLPHRILSGILKLMGKKRLEQRLMGNLQVDISKAQSLLGWSPPYTFKEGIERTIKYYNDGNDKTNF